MPIRLANMKGMHRCYDWQEDGKAVTPTDICRRKTDFPFLEGNSAKMCQNAQKVYTL